MRKLPLLALVLMSLAAGGSATGQQYSDDAREVELVSYDAEIAEVSECDSFYGCDACSTPKCCCDHRRSDRVFGAVDALLIRPHFSEAVAFARGSQTATSYDVAGQPILFDYEASVRAMIGLDLARSSDAVQFTYTFLHGDASRDGTVDPGEFIVDPFGNVVGDVTIIDPSDARVGTTVPGGDLIRTHSTVDAHVYDIDFVRRWGDPCHWAVSVDIGARIADIEQTYDSHITSSGADFSYGTFGAEFIGAGPHLGIEGARVIGPRRKLKLHASTHGSLLLGDYDVNSGNALGGGAFIASQTNTQRRTLGILETEMGGSWRCSDCLEISSGWLFQLWNDVGVSGGTFGGLFNGADDANNMSFDGLFVRVALRR